MDGMLSQEEINALLGGLSGDTDIPSNTGEAVELSPEEKDVLGEISNICINQYPEGYGLYVGRIVKRILQTVCFYQYRLRGRSKGKQPVNLNGE